MNKTVKWILIVVAVLIAGFVIAKLVGGKDEGTKVSTEKANNRTIIETVTASGNIYPEVEVKISPDISGEITELNVHEGDSVKKGFIGPCIRISMRCRDEAASQECSEAGWQTANTLEAQQAALGPGQTNCSRNKSLRTKIIPIRMSTWMTIALHCQL
jgi:HlyD family secretion protein